jgi:DNA-binding transcriptional MerR regulator
MIAQDHPALVVAEVCVQSYAAMKQTCKQGLGDEVMCNLGNGRNAFTGMVAYVSKTCTTEEAKIAVCGVLTHKKMPNPMRNELKHAAANMSTTPRPGIAAGCRRLYKETDIEALKRMLKLLKRVGSGVKEYAEHLGVQPNTIYQWTASNRRLTRQKRSRIFEAAAEIIERKTMYWTDRLYRDGGNLDGIVDGVILRNST